MMVGKIAACVAAAVASVTAVASTPEIVSSRIRANDPTVLEVVYRVASDKPTVNTRALAFEDGERSFWKVVRPETFIDGTAANIGDGIAANVEHSLAWKVSADWAVDLAKVKFEILTSEQGRLPLDLITIPATDKTPEVTVSYNSQTSADVFNALLWHYADGAADLRIEDGYLYRGADLLSNRTSPANMAIAVDYIFGKMGYEGLNGPVADFARAATRKALSFNSSVQNGCLKAALSGDLYVGKNAYCVVDVSGGKEAKAYSVSYLDSCPLAGWGDEYKTSKILLRRIEPGTVKMGGTKPVTLTKPFYIGVFEITQKQYELVTGKTPSSYKGDMRPVERVSWNDIRGDSSAFDWPNVKAADPVSFVGLIQAKTGLEFDLPTESQWEYACKAGTTTYYNNGSNITSDLSLLGRYADNRVDGRGGYQEHTTVGSYLPNAWGLYDMHGNVFEWCLDWYGGITSDPATDFVGAASGSARVLRGGCWNDGSNFGSDFARSSRRYRFNPSFRINEYGFRLSRTLANE